MLMLTVRKLCPRKIDLHFTIKLSHSYRKLILTVEVLLRFTFRRGELFTNYTIIGLTFMMIL